jgi:hypothetical protein
MIRRFDEPCRTVNLGRGGNGKHRHVYLRRLNQWRVTFPSPAVMSK